MSTQNYEDFFVFDMDNTLIKTDMANNLAYFEAISSVLGVNYTFDSKIRFTRNELKDFFPKLSKSQFDEIVSLKEKYFESYLKKTELNVNLFQLLRQYHHEGRHTILLTNSHLERAVSLCNYYCLTKYFAKCFYKEDYDGSKYAFLISQGYDLSKVVLFENEESPALEAVRYGINPQKIFKIEF